MKILFMTRRFWPQIGGVETHVMELTKCLEKLGHEITIITEEFDGSQTQQGATLTGADINATVHRIPVGNDEKQKKFLIWKWLRNNTRLMEQADIIHCHDVFFWYLPFRVRYPGKKVYTTFHGYETVYPPRKNAIRIRKLSEKLSNGTIIVGDYIKKWYGTHPTFVTYGGVHSRGVRDEDPLITKKDIRIVFLGRMDMDTGVMEYAKLLQLLKVHNINFTFTGVGDGPLKHEFSSFGELHGFQSNTESFIHHADVVFASSYLSMLEALAAKKLVIAFYDNPLKQDYLLMSPFGKYIVAEESSHKAFDKIKYFILNPNRLRTMISEGHVWAHKQSWDEVTHLYLKLWKK